MLKRLVTLCFCFALLFSFGCAAKISAPKHTDGTPVTLHYYCDKSITNDVTPENAEQIEEVANFMQQHFNGFATKSGYNVDIIEDKSTFAPKQGHYLLSVKVKKYNPGSKALRIMVGFGAGAASMDTYYELSEDGSTTLLAKNDGVGTSNPNWALIPAKLNEKMLIQVTKALKKRI